MSHATCPHCGARYCPPTRHGFYCPACRRIFAAPRVVSLEAAVLAQRVAFRAALDRVLDAA